MPENKFEVGYTGRFEINDDEIKFIDPAVCGNSVLYYPGEFKEAVLREILRPSNKWRKTVFYELRFREPSKGQIRRKRVTGTVGVDAGIIAIESTLKEYDDFTNGGTWYPRQGVLSPDFYLVNCDDGGYAVYEVSDDLGACGLILNLANYEPESWEYNYDDDDNPGLINFIQDYMEWSWGFKNAQD